MGAFDITLSSIFPRKILLSPSFDVISYIDVMTKAALWATIYRFFSFHFLTHLLQNTWKSLPFLRPQKLAHHAMKKIYTWFFPKPVFASSFEVIFFKSKMLIKSRLGTPIHRCGNQATFLQWTSSSSSLNAEMSRVQEKKEVQIPISHSSNLILFAAHHTHFVFFVCLLIVINTYTMLPITVVIGCHCNAKGKGTDTEGLFGHLLSHSRVHFPPRYWTWGCVTLRLRNPLAIF